MHGGGVVVLIYSLANQKGGVGKSASAAALAAACTEKGERTLIVDCDPHAGVTKSLGVDPDALKLTLYDVLLGRAAIADVAIRTKISGMDLVPANEDLAAAEAELIGEIGWDRTLKEALAPLTEYDRVFLDCPPSLGVLTVNALVASSTCLVPLQCEFLAMRGLQQLQKIIDKVRQKANPSLAVRIIRTMYDPRTLHSREVSDEIAQHFGELVFTQLIKRTVKFADATVAGEPITTFASTSEASEAYRSIAKEL
jgi:chromosome partitioning protein